MSVYSLTTASEKAIGMLLTAGGGSETLLLRRPANELRAELHLEPAGRTLTAVILLGHQRNTLTLQDGDGANPLNLADYIEAIANGTADSAETGAIGAPAELASCCKCNGEAIGYCYLAPGSSQDWLHGVKCRYSDCQKVESANTPREAHAAWNAIQRQPLPVKVPFTLCEHDLQRLHHLARIGGTRHLQCAVSVTVHSVPQIMRRDALVTTPAGTTHLHGGTPGELFASAVQHIEAALNAV